MDFKFRKATATDLDKIWTILEDAIQRRKEDGSNQWQDGYPNKDVLKKDLTKNAGHVLILDNIIVGYCSILINDEPEYANIDGKWLTQGNFIVYHRVAIAKNYIGKGLSKILLQHIEDFAKKNNIFSIKADTNFDNNAMKYLFKKLDYTYCGLVTFRGSPREAYEKVLH